MFTYGAVARQDVIISQYAAIGGSFDVVVVDVLKKANQPSPQLAYRDGDHTYFVLHDDAGLNFVIVGASSTQAQDANPLLTKLQHSFLTNPATRSWREAPPYGLQNEFADAIREVMAAANDQIERQLHPPPEPVLQPLDKRARLLLEREEGDDSPGFLKSNFWTVVHERRFWLIGGGIGVFLIVALVIALA